MGAYDKEDGAMGDGRATAATAVARTWDRRSGRERIGEFHVATAVIWKDSTDSAGHGCV